jgi:protein TonB
MERPHHLNIAEQKAGSKVTGLAIVIAIHVVAIMGLAIALNQGAIMKQIQEIKATVDTAKEIPKAPPPPPPDMVKPPPPTAIIPEFTVATAAPPPVTTAPKAPPPPPKAAAITNDPLRPIMRTHTAPPYPPISVRLGESGTTQMTVSINTEGTLDACTIDKSSGSDRLDTTACDWIRTHWRWQPPTFEGKPTAAKARVAFTWDLKNAK